jgi:hypothetical protein
MNKQDIDALAALLRERRKSLRNLNYSSSYVYYAGIVIDDLENDLVKLLINTNRNFSSSVFRVKASEDYLDTYR